MRINGTIVDNDSKWVYDMFDIDSFSPNDLYKELDKLGEYDSVDIEINSPGGYVTAGSEIYTALINHKGEVNVTITGLAASMASVIAMAGTHVKISPTARIMIHNASATAGGDYRDFDRYSKQLKKTNEVISNAYLLKANVDREEVLEMMNEETWLTPDEAIKYGFADEIMAKGVRQEQLVAGYMPKLLPIEVVEKAIKNKEQEELQLLKLKGEVNYE